MNIDIYYLDLKKVSRLQDHDDRTYIRDLYQSMLQAHSEPSRKKEAEHICQTLVANGYLINMRKSKISNILKDMEN